MNDQQQPEPHKVLIQQVNINLQQHIAKIAGQLAVSHAEIGAIDEENKQLQQENQKLKNEIEQLKNGDQQAEAPKPKK